MLFSMKDIDKFTGPNDEKKSSVLKVALVTKLRTHYTETLAQDVCLHHGRINRLRDDIPRHKLSLQHLRIRRP